VDLEARFISVNVCPIHATSTYVKDFLQFFQRTTLRFDGTEIDNNGLKDIPYDIDDIVLSHICIRESRRGKRDDLPSR
jgi:hypothetical protein